MGDPIDWDKKAEKVMAPKWRVLYFAVLIVLVLLITMYLYLLAYGKEGFMDMPKDTPISGGGLGATGGNTQAQASGPTMRFASTQSQPNQGIRNTAYNDDVVFAAAAAGLPSPGDEQTVKELEAVAKKVDRQRPQSRRNERLVSNRYGPEFAEYFDDELNKYQAELPPMEYAVVDRLTQGSTGREAFVSGAQLSRALYPGA